MGRDHDGSGFQAAVELVHDLHALSPQLAYRLRVVDQLADDREIASVGLVHGPVDGVLTTETRSQRLRHCHSHSVTPPGRAKKKVALYFSRQHLIEVRLESKARLLYDGLFCGMERIEETIVRLPGVPRKAGVRVCGFEVDRDKVDDTRNATEAVRYSRGKIVKA